MNDHNQLLPFSTPEKGTHKLDKFKDHLISNTKLGVRDQDYFEKMKKAWSWSSKMFSPAQVVTMLYNEYGHEKTHAYQILRDSYELWGVAYELDKRGVTKTLIEAAHVALSISIRDKDADGILRASAQIAKLNKLDQVDNIIPPDVAMPTGMRVYIVNGEVQQPESEGKEVIDVEGEDVH